VRSIDEIVNGVLEGDTRALARAITMVENEREGCEQILKRIYPHTGHAYVVGLTGAPGVGKSTLVDRLAKLARGHGHSVGILAVDPTSPFSGGAILGDRVRMQSHSGDPGVFIRSLATRGHLGGLSRASGGVIQLMDAAGRDLILVETVGSGQSEVEIMRYAHTVVVVVIAGLGDEIQMIKAGILEIGDVFCVNKADREGSDRTVADLRMLADSCSEGWIPPVVKTQARSGEGVDQLYQAIIGHRQYLESTGDMRHRQLRSAEAGIRDIIIEQVVDRTLDLARAEQVLDGLLERLTARQTDPYQAAKHLLNAYGSQILRMCEGDAE